jgi:hypothetical protein
VPSIRFRASEAFPGRAASRFRGFPCQGSFALPRLSPSRHPGGACTKKPVQVWIQNSALVFPSCITNNVYSGKGLACRPEPEGFVSYMIMEIARLVFLSGSVLPLQMKNPVSSLLFQT